MILIAHRGLISGPDKNLENTPESINHALDKGFDCEIDLWVLDSQFYLGHDNPQFLIDYNFLDRSGLWIHAKNLEALYRLSITNLNYFWHQEDDFTLTSYGYIWTYPGKKLTNKSISVLPEWHTQNLNDVNINCYGICSDYVQDLKYICEN